MNKKEKYKKSARNLLVSGIMGLVLGLLFKVVINNTRTYSFFTGNYSTWKFLSALLGIAIVWSIVELILSIVYAVMAANEPDDFVGHNNINNGYQGNNSPQNINYNSYGQNRNVNFPANNKPVEPLPSAGFWKCIKCGRINAGYVGTCGCGERNPSLSKSTAVLKSEESKTACKPEDKAHQTAQDESKTISLEIQQEVLPEVAQKKTRSFCQYCGERIIKGSVFCAYCGEKLD